jgi:2-amino-4-hydroxy-6-hydroxymethyldihydropteridine diphosphokinase
LDLLLYGQENIQNERLSVPHVGLLERDFVVIPLLDLDVNMQVKTQQLKDLSVIQHPTVSLLDDESWANI